MNFVLNSMGLILLNVYTNDRGQTGIWLTVGTDEMVFGRCFSGEWHGILDFLYFYKIYGREWARCKYVGM